VGMVGVGVGGLGCSRGKGRVSCGASKRTASPLLDLLSAVYDVSRGGGRWWVVGGGVFLGKGRVVVWGFQEDSIPPAGPAFRRTWCEQAAG
jgi:hypothetical protein